MTVVRLSPQSLAIKLATREAVRAAGGQEFVAAETRRSQSRISDYCSPNKECLMPADLVARVEALGAGSPGHPHITRALARAQGGAFVPSPASVLLELPNLGAWLAEIAGESSDVMRAVASEALTEDIAALPDRRRVAISDEVHDLIERLAAFALELNVSDTS